MNAASTQCVLRNGNTSQVAFIPSVFATEGSFVKLRNGGVWTDGWKVEHAGVEMPYEYVRERSQDYKNTRKASDI
jgi:hypothetical protein